MPFALGKQRGSRRSAELSAIVETAAHSNTVLLGPGMLCEPVLEELIGALCQPEFRACLVLDALALQLAPRFATQLRTIRTPAILTPHAGEMARLCGKMKEEVADDPLRIARAQADRLCCVVVLKGCETWICAPDAPAYVNRAGNVGLATSGSGDTLGGLIAGLAARGAPPVQAPVWGVYLHGSADDRLAKKTGSMGYLARELPAEIPPLMDSLRPRAKR